MPITNETIKELLPLSFNSTPAVSIRKENEVWIATSMLIHYLESFTDSLVVTEENEKPIGVIGGREIIENIFKDPSSNFFDNTTVEQIVDKNLVILSDKTSLGELLNTWKKTRRAFSIIPNNLGWYSAISGRKLLEIGANCVTDLTVSELPKKEVATFEKDSTIKDIISLMLEKNTRKLLLKDTNYFISDRLLIQSISQEFDFFRNVKFLERRFEESLKLEEVKKISKDVNLADITEGFTGADIASFIDTAVMLAIREYISKYEDPIVAGKNVRELKVRMHHIEKAMSKIKPLSKEEIDWYQQIADKFGKPPKYKDTLMGAITWQ